MTRLGLALVSPRWALAIAGDRRNPGRSGSDLMRVMGMLLVSGHLRGLVVAGWLAVGVHFGLGLRTGGAVLSAALSTPLAFLVISAGVLWLGSGRARHLGRAFDLASVAVVPLLMVLIVGVTVTQVLELHSPVIGLVTLGTGFAWAGALVTLALRPARMRASVAAVPTPQVAQQGQRAGRVAVAVAAVALGLQLGWIALHADELRPVVADEPAPAFALPEVGADGALGKVYTFAPGASARPLVIDFWATWCGVCLRGLPALEALRKEHPELDVVSINLDDAELARKMLDDRGYGLRLLFDDRGVAQRYNVSALPHLVVIDRSGRVHAVKRGHPGDLEALLHDERASH